MAGWMADPESPAGDPAQAVDCVVCGTPVAVREWHPVASDTVAGETRIVPFCSPDCRERWMAEVGPRGES